MTAATDGYRFGIEEEYFLADGLTGLSPTETAADRFHAGRERIEAASPELLKGQVEVQTDPETDLDAAAARLRHLRRELAHLATEADLALFSAGSHPLAWPDDQKITDKDRYRRLAAKVGVMAGRATVCAMHVHVEVPDPDRRIEAMNRVMAFLPLLFALSTSSPMWQGRDSGLKAFRLAAFAPWPHMGLPDLFDDQADYERFIARLVAAHVVKDASFVWWLIRPSAHYPTLELRVCDSCPRVDDAVAIAALYRCLVRAVTMRPDRFPLIDAIGRGICEENIWQVQRHGLDAHLIEAHDTRSVAIRDALEETLGLVAEDAHALGATAWIERTREVFERGTSADRQLACLRAARAAGHSAYEAAQAVVHALCVETLA